MIEPILSSHKQDPINRMLIADVATLLPANNLIKPDRMAMAHSLEIRAPFLDYRLCEFAFKIPGHLKLAKNDTKSLLKKAMKPLIGAQLIKRPKQMFTVPIGEWMKQKNNTFFSSILKNNTLAERGIINPQQIQNMWSAHTAGKQNHTRELRSLMALELWFRVFENNDV